MSSDQWYYQKKTEKKIDKYLFLIQIWFNRLLPPLPRHECWPAPGTPDSDKTVGNGHHGAPVRPTLLDCGSDWSFCLVLAAPARHSTCGCPRLGGEAANFSRRRTASGWLDPSVFVGAKGSNDLKHLEWRSAAARVSNWGQQQCTVVQVLTETKKGMR